MTRNALLAAGLAAAVAVGMAAPAPAQSGRTYTPPGTRHRPPQNPGQTIYLPPPPLMQNSLGLLEEGFQYMRATAPRPDEFLYGRWNPQPVTIYPPIRYQPGYGGYYGGYGGYYGGYGGFYPGYGAGFYGSVNGSGIGFGFGGVFPGTTLQREVVIYRDGSGSAQQPSAGVSGPPPSRPAPPPARDRDPEDSGFYLGNRRPGAEERLSDALEDIRKAWLNQDAARLTARVQPDRTLRVYLKGQFKYAVDGREFQGLLRDAMNRIDTLAFEFDPVRQEGDPVLVTGRHTFLDAEKNKTTTHVSYRLARVRGQWKIVEAGSSSEPITGHRD